MTPMWLQGQRQGHGTANFSMTSRQGWRSCPWPVLLRSGAAGTTNFAGPHPNLVPSDLLKRASMGCLEGIRSEIGPNVTCRSYFPSREVTHHQCSEYFYLPIQSSFDETLSPFWLKERSSEVDFANYGVAEVTEEMENEAGAEGRHLFSQSRG